MSLYFQLASLSIIVLYAWMLFRNVDPLIATAICVGLGYLWNFSSPIAIGNSMAQALGSFMALVGFIIMLGRGLGEILTHTQVSHTLVHQIVYGIGINTQHRAKIGIVISCFIYRRLAGDISRRISNPCSQFTSHRRLSGVVAPKPSRADAGLS